MRIRRRSGPSPAPLAAIRGLVIGLAIFAPAEGRAEGAPAMERAKAVLATHCARCHASDRLEAAPAKGRLGDILDMSALARRETLIRPGDPDASPLYQLMVSRHSPEPVFTAEHAPPAPEEIQQIRDWIEALEADEDVARCRETREPIAPASLAEASDAWRRTMSQDATEAVRFLSFSSLYNLCRADQILEHYRGAAALMLARLSRDGRAPAVDTVGGESLLMAFRPQDVGMTLLEWDALAGEGGDVPGVAPAELIASRLMERPDIYAEGRGGNPAPIAGLDPAVALAAEWRERVSLVRAAAEMGIRPRAMESRLVESAREGPPDMRDPAIRLAQSTIARREWEAMKARLSGAPSAPDDKAGYDEARASTDGRLILDLWTDRIGYTVGDLLAIRARPSRDCYLTLVAVEPDGTATVLFPSDFARESRISGGTVLGIPGPGAEYQVRLDDPGRHRVIGICNTRVPRPEGVGHDLERQRFTMLGDWRSFLATTAEREGAYKAEQEAARRFRSRSRRRTNRVPDVEVPEQVLPLETEQEARAGVTIVVGPWPPEAAAPGPTPQTSRVP